MANPGHACQKWHAEEFFGYAKKNICTEKLQIYPFGTQNYDIF